MTLFLHARVHEGELRDAIEAGPLFGVLPQSPPSVACPRCGARYFADLAPNPDPAAWTTTARAAGDRLGRECPDHPHRFTVT
ncbi:MAG: hypothetical protein U0531_07420 [Dehalococcoidia bacterium]